jgi:hypothetical protein
MVKLLFLKFLIVKQILKCSIIRHWACFEVKFFGTTAKAVKARRARQPGRSAGLSCFVKMVGMMVSLLVINVY